MNPVNWREPVSDHGKVHYITLPFHPPLHCMKTAKQLWSAVQDEAAPKKIIASVFPMNT